MTLEHRVPSQSELAQQGAAADTIAGPNADQPAPPIARGPTAEQRTERAKVAANARWQAHTDWDTIAIAEGLAMLAELRAEGEKAGLVLQRRISQEQISLVKCYVCKKEITPESAKGSRTRHNFETGQPEIAYACSAGCFMELGRVFEHPRTQRG